MYNADINNSIELKLKYEKKPSKLNDIDGALSAINLEEALANSWEEYRNQLPENVKKDIPKGSYAPMGCAGEMAVILEFDILPSYFAVISEFGWTLCKARGIDPWNTSDCADWDVSPIDEIYIIGRYKFISKWADGTKLYSSINTMLSSPAYHKSYILFIPKNYVNSILTWSPNAANMQFVRNTEPYLSSVLAVNLVTAKSMTVAHRTMTTTLLLA